MKLAIVGSRELQVPDLERYLPPDVTEIISGGAKGVDTSAREYARSHGIPLTEILPDYGRYGRSAPLVRNREIVRRADRVLAFWNGASRGTGYVLEYCRSRGVPVEVVQMEPEEAGTLA